jgi:hypothetical protein
MKCMKAEPSAYCMHRMLGESRYQGGCGSMIKLLIESKGLLFIHRLPAFGNLKALL